MALPDPERTRRRVGLSLHLLATLVGLALLLMTFLVPPLFSEAPLDHYGAMLLGAVLAIPAGIMYLTVPRLLDRYDPEPWYALVGALVWGAIVACGFSAVINTAVFELARAAYGARAGEALSAVLSAPIVEESFKALGVFGVFYFLRREFDGVVDGIIYATFVALGFATVENVVYYAKATMSGEEVLATTVFLRGVLSPWVHPVYTCMTGIGFGIAREARSPAARGLAPFVGLGCAIFLHAVWNGSATFGGGIIFLLLLPLWLIFVVMFLVIVVVLVRRRGRIIREHLLDEVALGTIDKNELELVCSPFGLVRAGSRHGKQGKEFVRAAARLALSKWHTARAMKSRDQTVSMDFIVPLRRRIAELRGSLPPSTTGG